MITNQEELGQLIIGSGGCRVSSKRQHAGSPSLLIHVSLNCTPSLGICAVTSSLIRIISTLINIMEKLFFKASTLKLMDFFGPFSSLI